MCSKDCDNCVYKKEHVRRLAALRDAKRRRLQPERKSARTKAQYLKHRYPELQPEVCNLCGQEHEYLEMHHPDWAKPYEVAWLCRSCHRLWHMNKIEGPLQLHDLKEEAKAIKAARES